MEGAVTCESVECYDSSVWGPQSDVLSTFRITLGVLASCSSPAGRGGKFPRQEVGLSDLQIVGALRKFGVFGLPHVFP